MNFIRGFSVNLFFKHKPLYFKPLLGFVGMRFSPLPYPGASFCHMNILKINVSFVLYNIASLFNDFNHPRLLPVQFQFSLRNCIAIFIFGF